MKQKSDELAQESYSIASLADSFAVISRESITLDSFIRTIGYFNVYKQIGDDRFAGIQHSVRFEAWSL